MKFKKMLAVVSALCMMCAVVPVLPEFVPETAVISASAEGEEEPESIYENLKYRKYADYVEISGVTGKEITEANIPAEIDGLPVTSIETLAFASCSALTSVTIPDSVTNIGGYAFLDTPWLKAKQAENPLVIVNDILIDGRTCKGEVIIPDGVKIIGERAFYNAENMTSVIIPDSVTSIKGLAFERCNLTSVEIPESVTSIEREVFTFCSSLTSVKLPENLTSIETWLFYGCSALKSITIPENVTSIGRYAFFNCNSLTSIVIPENVTSIEEGTFCDCSALESITIPENVTDIGTDAFLNTPWLKAKQAENPLVIFKDILIDGKACEGDITIPDSIKSIVGSAFSGCSALTSVIIPESVTSIGNGAFSGCSGLTSVTIPETITSIKDWTFQGAGLTSVTIPDSVTSIGSSAFSGCSSLTSVTIPESVTSIKGYAFLDTPWLEAKQAENPLVVINNILIDGKTSKGNIIISDDVKNIGDYAFQNCATVASVIIPKSVTTIGNVAFGDCYALESITIQNPECNFSDYIGGKGSGGTETTIYGYENSTAQAYAEKYGYTFEVLGSAPETSEPTETETSAPVAPAENMVWNGVNPDINRDGTIDAADSAVLLTYAAEFGAGKVSSFKEFMDKYYS